MDGPVEIDTHCLANSMIDLHTAGYPCPQWFSPDFLEIRVKKETGCTVRQWRLGESRIAQVLEQR